MALIKVLIIFVVILALLNKRLPLYLAMIFGSLLMIVMFRLPLATAGQTALHTLTGWDVWSVNLAMYVISVLVYELDLAPSVRGCTAGDEWTNARPEAQHVACLHVQRPDAGPRHRDDLRRHGGHDGGRAPQKR